MDKKSINYKDKYLKYKEKYLKLKNHNMCSSSCVQSGGNNQKLELILFKADWCGHCKRFSPIWQEMQEKYKKDFNFITIDSTEKEQLKNWNVNSFPTIFVKNKNTAVEFEGIREEDEIIKFTQEVKQM